MSHRIVVPEGRSEYEWFRLLADMLETADVISDVDLPVPSFGTVVGVVPTHNSAVAETFAILRRVRDGLVPLVDGDKAGDDKIIELRGLQRHPRVILQWRDTWTIEDAIGWILEGGDIAVLTELKSRIDREFADIPALVELFKVKTGAGRLKTDYLAYEEVVSVVRDQPACRQRAATLLDSIRKACVGLHEECEQVAPDDVKSSDECTVLRVAP